MYMAWDFHHGYAHNTCTLNILKFWTLVVVQKEEAVWSASASVAILANILFQNRKGQMFEILGHSV